MNQLPQLPDHGSRQPGTRDSSRWIDLIAFLGVLALGGVLMTVVPATVVSIATACVALGGLYRLWKRSHASDDDQRS
jgi:Flp pilus assembly protein TadB